MSKDKYTLYLNRGHIYLNMYINNNIKLTGDKNEG